MTPGNTLVLVAALLFLIAACRPSERAVMWGGIAAANWLMCLANLLDSLRWAAAVNAVLATVFTWLWWKNRRRGRGQKAAKALGAKSKARVQALVRQMTPSPIPSPRGGKA